MVSLFDTSQIHVQKLSMNFINGITALVETFPETLLYNSNLMIPKRHHNFNDFPQIQYRDNQDRITQANCDSNEKAPRFCTGLSRSSHFKSGGQENSSVEMKRGSFSSAFPDDKSHRDKAYTQKASLGFWRDEVGDFEFCVVVGDVRIEYPFR
jgi:hypothetical protein